MQCRFILLPLLLVQFSNSFAQDSTTVSKPVVADTAADSGTDITGSTSLERTSAGTAEDSTLNVSAEAVVADSGATASVDSAAHKKHSGTPVAKKPIPAPGMRNVEKERQRNLATVEKDTSNTRKIKLIKRNYNHRQQVVLAVGMMLFIGIMMSTAQSMNPK